MTIPAELYATACVRTERFAPYVGDERFFLGRDGDSHPWTWLSV